MDIGSAKTVLQQQMALTRQYVATSAMQQTQQVEQAAAQVTAQASEASAGAAQATRSTVNYGQPVKGRVLDITV